MSDNSSSDEYELRAQSGAEVAENYNGPRDKTFIDFIRTILVLGDMKEKYIDMLTDPKSMIEYAKAFTHDSVDESNNYQIYEQLGDVTANKFIVWYMYRRFPQLMCTSGVKVVARLRINYGSKQSFSGIADDLGFWPFISASTEIRDTKMKPLKEDTFEAFIGVTEFLLDSRVQNGVGNAIVYNILENIFNKKPISLAYEDLYDAKTRLKELFDTLFDKKNEAKYISVKGEDRITRAIVYSAPKQSRPTIRDGVVIPNRDWVEIGIGSKALKIDAEQLAATKGLEWMKRRGHVKAVPEEYRMFSGK